MYLHRIFLVCVTLKSVYSGTTQKWDDAKVTKSTICKAPECQQMSTSLLRIVNTKENPCMDFYNFACGKWERQNSMPPNRGEWSVAARARATAIENLRALLQQKEKRSDTDDVVKAKKLYHACTKLPSLKRGNSDFVRSILKQIGTWVIYLSSSTEKSHEVSTWMLDNYYLKNTGESAFFDVGMMSNYQKKDKPLLLIKPLYSSYGTITRSADWTEPEKAAYIKFLMEVVGILAAKKKTMASHTSLKNDMDEVLRFRRKLDKLAALSNSEKLLCKPQTVEAIYNKFNGVKKDNQKAKINWLEHIRVLYVNMDHETYDPSIMIGLCQEEYFFALTRLLSETNAATIVNHIHIYFVERHLELNARQKEYISQSISAYLTNGAQHGRIRYSTERWESCITNHNMKNTLTKMYVNAHLPKNTKAAVEKVVEELKDILELEVSESEWLNADLKEDLMRKIQTSFTAYGYTVLPKTPTIPTSPRSSLTDVRRSNSYFEMERNEIVINVPSIQPPLYSTALPYVITYARVGYIVGREIQNIFSKQEVSQSPIPSPPASPRRGISPVQSIARSSFLDNKKQCFLQQYKNFLIEEFGNVPFPLSIGDLMIDENMADTVGLMAAYKAYKKKLWEMDGECSVLPHLEKAGCDKLFFVAYATQFCTTTLPGVLQKYLDKDSHSIPKFRATGPLFNMEEFSDTFGCKAYTRMNATVKCDVW